MWTASLGKRKQKRVKVILENMNYYAYHIQNMLVNKTYVPTEPQVITIQDGANKKTRTIHKPNFYPDQVIHWALMLQLESVIMRGMYIYNCGSVQKRGTSYGQKAIRKWMDRDV